MTELWNRYLRKHGVRKRNRYVNYVLEGLGSVLTFIEQVWLVLLKPRCKNIGMFIIGASLAIAYCKIFIMLLLAFE